MNHPASGAKPIAVMGIFVADLAFLTPRLPVWGETVLGQRFVPFTGESGNLCFNTTATISGIRLAARRRRPVR